MAIPMDLSTIIIIRIGVLSLSSGFLLFRWIKTKRRFYTDFPFLMGIFFLELAMSKVLDIFLYDVLNGVDFSAMESWHKDMPLAYLRWGLMIAVLTPLLLANLKIWMAGKTKYLWYPMIAYTLVFFGLIFSTQSFRELNNLTIFLLVPIAILTIVTFGFAYKKKRLPNVHGLLVAVSWIGYLISTAVRPIFMEMGNPPWGQVDIIEFVDTILFTVMFLGFVMRPKFGKKTYLGSHSIQEKTLDKVQISREMPQLH